MANLNVIVPCAVLGAICAVMLAFIWWWFPRTWKKGNKQDTEAIDLSVDPGSDGDGLTQKERRQLAGQRAREYLQAIELRNQARAEGRELNDPPPVYQGFGRGAQGNEAPVYTV